MFRSKSQESNYDHNSNSENGQWLNESYDSPSLSSRTSLDNHNNHNNNSYFDKKNAYDNNDYQLYAPVARGEELIAQDEANRELIARIELSRQSEGESTDKTPGQLMREGVVRLLALHLTLFAFQGSIAVLNITTKACLERMSHIPFISVRIWGAIPFILLAALLRERQEFIAAMSSRIYRIALWMSAGVVIVAIAQMLHTFGIDLSGPLDAAAIHTTIPVLVNVFLISIKRTEPVTRIKLVGLAISLLFVLPMTIQPLIWQEWRVFWGNFLLMFPALIFAAYFVWGERLGEEVYPLTATFWMFVGAGLTAFISLPIAWQEYTHLFFSDSKPWAYLIIATLIGTCLPYLLFTVMFKRAALPVTILYTAVEFILTLILDALFLHDGVSIRGLVCIIGIYVGLALVMYSKIWELKVEDVVLDTDEPDEGGDIDLKEGTPLLVHYNRT